jgi:hypothetical protein
MGERPKKGSVRVKDLKKGQLEYQSFCASFHGSDAKGNGPSAAQIGVQPSDLTQLAKKNGGVFPREIRSNFQLFLGVQQNLMAARALT